MRIRWTENQIKKKDECKTGERKKKKKMNERLNRDNEIKVDKRKDEKGKRKKTKIRAKSTIPRGMKS